MKSPGVSWWNLENFWGHQGPHRSPSSLRCQESRRSRWKTSRRWWKDFADTTKSWTTPGRDDTDDTGRHWTAGSQGSHEPFFFKADVNGESMDNLYGWYMETMYIWIVYMDHHVNGHRNMVNLELVDIWFRYVESHVESYVESMNNLRIRLIYPLVNVYWTYGTIYIWEEMWSFHHPQFLWYSKTPQSLIPSEAINNKQQLVVVLSPKMSHEINPSKRWVNYNTLW